MWGQLLLRWEHEEGRRWPRACVRGGRGGGGKRGRCRGVAITAQKEGIFLHYMPNMTIL